MHNSWLDVPGRNRPKCLLLTQCAWQQLAGSAGCTSTTEKLQHAAAAVHMLHVHRGMDA